MKQGCLEACQWKLKPKPSRQSNCAIVQSDRFHIDCYGWELWKIDYSENKQGWQMGH